ncbi:MAG TPA: helix-turn-helix transcriptional regulator [Clostridiaceae bacterium]|nr:helix-turn-helix transcriptional regulator [Clostridiaceae bacterium]
MEHWEKISAVQRMQDYIEEHITDHISLQMLANVAKYSPWHCIRIFRELTGKTPFEYIRALRLSKAAEKLQNTGKRIIDVALDFDFDSHEGFTRAFSRQFGVTPRVYSKNAPPIKLFMPVRVRDYYLKLQKGEIKMTKDAIPKTVFVQVIERPARKLILKRGINATHYFEYCEEVGCDVWDVLTNIKEAIYEPFGMWLPENMRKPGTSTYAQGVEVSLDYSGEIPDGFDVIELQPCKMMVFQGQPYEDENFQEAISELWEVMNNYNPEIYGYQWADEDAPRIQLEPLGYRGYIEARPVREINKK